MRWLGGQPDKPADEQLLSVEVRDLAVALAVVVTGEIDVLTTPRFQDAVAGALGRAAVPVVVDLTNVTFLASSGLAALVTLTSLARLEHLPLRIVVDHNRPVITPLQITDLDNVLALYESVEQALAQR